MTSAVTKILANTALISLATSVAITATASADPGPSFSKLDKDHDGFLIEGEILPGSDSSIIEKLDKNRDGKVSEVEFNAVRKTMYIPADSKIMLQSGDGGKLVLEGEELKELVLLGATGTSDEVPRVIEIMPNDMEQAED